jgi:hypothetical protein
MMSYRTLNQIFYTNNKFDEPDKLKELEEYFMNLSIDLAYDDLLHSPVDMTVIKESTVDLFDPKPVPPASIKKSEAKKGFVSKDRDALFWCIFAYQYGEMEYTMIRTNYGKRKVDEKIKIYSWLKDNKSAIKTYPSMKITNVMYQEMLSELMCVQSDTGFLSIIAFSLYYKINIYLVNEVKKTYLEFLGQGEVESEAKPCFLYRLDRGYRLSDEPQNLESMIKLESYQKPLKAISNWKLVELEEVAQKLGMENCSSMKKPELYQTIIDYCVWK